MSYTFFVDGTYNDFRISNGSILLARGSDVVVQQIKIALLTEFGEWFLDTNVGIPYYSSEKTLNDNNNPGILGGKLSAAEISAILRLAILSVPDVISIEKFTIEEADTERGVKVNATVSVQSSAVNSVGTQNIEIVTVSV